MESGFNTIGVDLGYGNTKIVSKLGQFVIPSVVGSYEKPLFDIGLGDGEKGKGLESDVVMVGDKPYYVGLTALKQSSLHYQLTGRDWFSGPAYEALVRYAMKVAVNGKQRPVHLVTGLPVKYMEDSARIETKYRQAVIDSLAVKGLPVTVEIIPQPLGAFFHAALNNDGGLKSKEYSREYSNGTIGIIDIGFYTTDIVVISEAEPIHRLCATFENGVGNIFTKISADLADKFKTDQSTFEARKLEKAIREGFVKLSGKTYDILDVTLPRLKEAAQEIKARVKGFWGDGMALDSIYMAGGGSALLQNYLQEDFYQNTKIVDDPQIANASGFWKKAERAGNGKQRRPN